jgi:hypothetical protein
VSPIAADDIEAPKTRSFSEWYYGTSPVLRLGLRWALILACSALAFWPSVLSLAHTTRSGALGGYVWTVPVAAVLVLIGIGRRPRSELPIHDRQTDIIVGTMGLVLALLVKGVLTARFAFYFDLLRLDFVALWLFVLSSCIVLFGLRPVSHFALVWGLLFMMFPLPYYLVVVVLGGGTFAAGGAALIIGATATGIAVGRTRRRGLIGVLAASVVGLAVLTTAEAFFPRAPLVVFQLLPACTPIILVGIAMFLRSRRGIPKRIFDRTVEPLAARQVWAAVPLVIAFAVALSLVVLPTQANSIEVSRNAPRALTFGQPLVTPPGWQTVSRTEYGQVNRIYGPNALLVREQMTAEVGDFRYDKLGRPRTVMVDSVVSQRPFSFDVYPDRMVYGLTTARISLGREVDLGYGIRAQLHSVVDDRLLVTWNSLRFAWGDDELAQRVTISTVDNHDPDAPFPGPTGTLPAMLRTMFTLLFRGNAVLGEQTPSYKDGELLTEFGRSLVAAQFGKAGAP